MNFNLKRFARRAAPTRETATQVSAWDRRRNETTAAPGALSYATYAQMEEDAMIQTALTVKRLGVLAAPWHVSGADAARVDFVVEAFRRMDGSPNTILSAAMDSFAKGWSVQETTYIAENGRLMLAGVRPKDPAYFGQILDRFGNLEALKLQLPGEPEQTLPRSRFVIHVHRGGYGRPKGRSDLDAAYGHYTTKRSLLRAWKAHLDRFASPTVVGRYAAGLPMAQQQNLLDALTRLDENAAITIPSDIDVSTLGSSSDASRGFIEAVEFHNREMARAILGQTLTTDEGSRVGSLALGKVHLQVMLLQLQALRRELADTVMTEQVIRPLIELNFGPGEVPRFEFDEVPVASFTSGQLG